MGRPEFNGSSLANLPPFPQSLLAFDTIEMQTTKLDMTCPIASSLAPRGANFVDMYRDLLSCIPVLESSK